MSKKLQTWNAGSKSSDNPHRKAPGNGLRSKATIQRLNMYSGGKPIRNKDGKVVGGKLMMDNTAGGQKISGLARIAPDRRWFGNTRTISQTELDRFRDEMTTKQADPYSVVLRRKKIPMALLQDSVKVAKVNLLETETFDEVFGDKQRRKRPKFSDTMSDYAALMANAEEKSKAYSEEKDSNIEEEQGRGGDARKDDMFSKGQSKRIWGELYKVLDCSDVVLQIVDARNVPGTRCFHVENHIKKNAAHKHMVIIINKCDLVPAWVTRKWIKILSKDFPTLAFHASLTNAFGKGALISLLRQFGKLHSDKRQISVGVIGYPNTGKSSVINSLMGTRCCKAAPVPGETKIWQYITLMKRIFLIDCPGIVYDTGDDEVETVLKGKEVLCFTAYLS
jgi:nuclear GTP-binding protein